MHRLLLTLPSPAENLALDEALLDQAEADDPEWECLRLWESASPMVVVGRSSRLRQEVHESACAKRGIPVLRRSSGGAAVVAGPGCLMYAVVLSLARRPKLQDIRYAHTFVLGRIAEGLTKRGFPARHVGTSDLAISCDDVAQKISGNSLRMKRTHLLYHGTLLYDFDLSLISTCLRDPPRQPEYRAGRSHGDFVTNLPIARATLIDVVLNAWPTSADLRDWPQSRVAKLVAERFGCDNWNREFL